MKSVSLRGVLLLVLEERNGHPNPLLVAIFSFSIKFQLTLINVQGDDIQKFSVTLVTDLCSCSAGDLKGYCCHGNALLFSASCYICLNGLLEFSREQNHRQHSFPSSSKWRQTFFFKFFAVRQSSDSPVFYEHTSQRDGEWHGNVYSVHVYTFTVSWKSTDYFCCLRSF